MIDKSKLRETANKIFPGIPFDEQENIAGKCMAVLNHMDHLGVEGLRVFTICELIIKTLEMELESSVQDLSENDLEKKLTNIEIAVESGREVFRKHTDVYSKGAWNAFEFMQAALEGRKPKYMEWPMNSQIMSKTKKEYFFIGSVVGVLLTVVIYTVLLLIQG